jgi:Fe-S-cluster-containing dehydrogenase component
MTMQKSLQVLQDGGDPLAGNGPIDPARRAFMRTAAAGAAVSALACSGVDIGDFLRGHFKELSKDDLAKVLAKIEKKNKARFGKDTKVTAEGPQPGVEFGYGLDVSRCVGCRRCVYACVKENNQSRDPQIHWIKVLQMDKEHGVDFSHADAYYQPAQVPQDGHFYVPTACQQCRNAPCTKVCPTGATWIEPDGIVTIDYDWCIGCRCCMAACPYGARHFNWSTPSIPNDELNPSMHYLGNRPRPRGVVEKCTWCIQRTRAGRYPACVEVCPVGARKFGNLLDPDSEIRYIIEHKRVMVLKEELNTMPKFFYFYGT